ncbi:ImmA/IrrE family metallo-endopeptidase [Dolosigranulum pigrum]|uniref:ImmA/IrrE family metallo-endopeptidase n=1 Tax=Dolosigranulum pigrum TaxID=29394 RepID=UPI000DC31828|nr:ImmA/IrrE family metallo-endopeptidase [Dolosigranulum pigrum]QJS97870.1 ImmA/IrrE family metallo-endopeptidase [Dolosigranulum pigrum]
MIHHHICRLYDMVHTYNPFELVEYFNIRLKYVPFLDSPKGQYVKLLDTPYILLSEELKHSSGRYFILSHELFHALEHSDLTGYYTLNERATNELEYEANKFGVLLCMYLYKEMHDYDLVTVEHIQQRYQIPNKLSYLIEANQSLIHF